MIFPASLCPSRVLVLVRLFLAFFTISTSVTQFGGLQSVIVCRLLPAGEVPGQNVELRHITEDLERILVPGGLVEGGHKESIRNEEVPTIGPIDQRRPK